MKKQALSILLQLFSLAIVTSCASSQLPVVITAVPTAKAATSIPFTPSPSPLPTQTPIAGYSFDVDFQYLANADGSFSYPAGGKLALFDNSGAVVKQIDMPLNFEFIDWSQDGQWIMFSEASDELPRVATFWAINVDDGRQIELFQFLNGRDGLKWHLTENRFVTPCLAEGLSLPEKNKEDTSVALHEICEVDMDTLHVTHTGYFGYVPSFGPDGSIYWLLPLMLSERVVLPYTPWDIFGAQASTYSDELAIYQLNTIDGQPTEVARVPETIDTFFSILDDGTYTVYSPSSLAIMLHDNEDASIHLIDISSGLETLSAEVPFPASLESLDASNEAGKLVVKFFDYKVNGDDRYKNLLFDLSDLTYFELDTYTVYWWSPDGRHLYGQPGGRTAGAPFEVNLSDGTKLTEDLPSIWQFVPSGQHVLRFLDQYVRPSPVDR